ncbi:MAG TPA: N-acetylneuraminate synthase [Planctomycetaceae bacterium]|nr:N-acetylneuraminate synthase [Planctomycetaceae bacterium]
MFEKPFEISGRRIGPREPCFVIAEAGVNHNGSLSMAFELIDAAATAGADAVKFQTFCVEQLMAPDTPTADYQKANTDEASQFEMLRKLELSRDDHVQLMQYCRKKELLFLSTPFEEKSAGLLASLDVPAFKIPSGEIPNIPFLSHVARFGKPMIVSTGMCGLGEVETAVRAIQNSGDVPLALLHCVSAYPADPATVNLRAMETLSHAFGLPVGFSDHTRGLAVPAAAVALGATIIEKHFTLSRNLAGPDHLASLEPDELVDLVETIRSVESAMGDGQKVAVSCEANTAEVARKSLVAAVDITAGAILSKDIIAIRRPGTGLSPAMLPFVVNRTAVSDIRAGTVLRMEDVA